MARWHSSAACGGGGAACAAAADGLDSWIAAVAPRPPVCRSAPPPAPPHMPFQRSRRLRPRPGLSPGGSPPTRASGGASAATQPSSCPRLFLQCGASRWGRPQTAGSSLGPAPSRRSSSFTPTPPNRSPQEQLERAESNRHQALLRRSALQAASPVSGSGNGGHRAAASAHRPPSAPGVPPAPPSSSSVRSVFLPQLQLTPQPGGWGQQQQQQASWPAPVAQHPPAATMQQRPGSGWLPAVASTPAAASLLHQRQEQQHPQQQPASAGFGLSLPSSLSAFDPPQAHAAAAPACAGSSGASGDAFLVRKHPRSSGCGVAGPAPSSSWGGGPHQQSEWQAQPLAPGADPFAPRPGSWQQPRTAGGWQQQPAQPQPAAEAPAKATSQANGVAAWGGRGSGKGGASAGRS